jgi:hypothetical protein
MSKLKILITVLFLGLGLGGAYFIISNSTAAAPQAQNSNLDITNNNPVGTEIATSTIASSTANLSEVLAKKIATEMAAANPNGTINVSGKNYVSAPKPENLANDLYAEAQKNFDPNSLRPVIKDSDIKISDDNSKDALTNYFVSFNEIIINNAKNIPQNILSSNSDPQTSDFAQITDIYKKGIADFYSLSVPSKILDIDKKEIELLTTEKNIYQALANMDQDPVTANLALNELPNIYQEFDNLKITIDNFIKTNQLNINTLQ